MFYLAFIEVCFAESSCKSGLTAAGEVVDAVDARGIVLTRVTLALVNVHLAVDTLKQTSQK